MLCQLSYAGILTGEDEAAVLRKGLNHGTAVYQSDALPTELRRNVPTGRLGFRAQVTYITRISHLRKSYVSQRVATSPFKLFDIHRMLVDLNR